MTERFDAPTGPLPPDPLSVPPFRPGESPRPEGGVYASEVTPESVAWLAPGRLAAGKMTDLVGDPGLGKSTLTVEWAARVSLGEALPDGDPGEPGGVVLLSAEDGAADTIRPRLEAAGADLGKVVLLTAKRDGSLHTLPSGLPAIEAWIREAGARLLIIDPLMALLDRDVNSFKDQDVRRALAPLAAMAERTGVAVVAVRHPNKAAGTSALHRGGGSIGIVGAARVGLLVAPDPDDPEARVLAATKSNLARLPDSLRFRLVPAEGSEVARIEYAGTSRYTADHLVGAGAGHQRGPRRLEQANALLLDFLSTGRRPAIEVTELATDAGVKMATLRRAKEALGIRSVKEGFGEGSVWMLELPDGGQDPA